MSPSIVIESIHRMIVNLDFSLNSENDSYSRLRIVHTIELGLDDQGE